MGLIRKTASIATLGLVDFRSTVERLEREQTVGDKARTRLAEAEAEIERLGARAAKQDKRRAKAERDLLASARAERRSRAWRRRKTVKAASGAVSDGEPLEQRRARRMARRADKAEKKARKAEKKAERAQRKAQKAATKAADTAQAAQS